MSEAPTFLEEEIADRSRRAGTLRQQETQRDARLGEIADEITALVRSWPAPDDVVERVHALHVERDAIEAEMATLRAQLADAGGKKLELDGV